LSRTIVARQIYLANKIKNCHYMNSPFYRLKRIYFQIITQYVNLATIVS